MGIVKYFFFSLFSVRFKENNVIDKSLYNYNNTLEINDVQGLNGTFRCRAINQFGSEFSSVAELIVLGKTLIFTELLKKWFLMII